MTTTRTTTRTSSTTTSSSSTSTSTSKEKHLFFLSNLYKDAFLTNPSKIVLNQMQIWEQRTSVDVLRYALEEAACAPVPSWRYAMAILRSCDGIHVTVGPGQSLRDAIELARGWQDYQERRNSRMMAYSDDETQMPYAK